MFGRRWPVALLVTGLLLAGVRPAAGQVDFERDIRPIFAEHCTKCHGDRTQESDLRLDTGSGTRRGGIGGEIVVPGAAAASRLMRVLRGVDEEVEQMPPSGPPLRPAQIAAIEAWIDGGASVPETEPREVRRSDHWSLQSPVRAPLPAVGPSDWVKNEIDHFVLAKLQAAQLSPSPQAAAATLLRRASLDLRGLPPTLSEIRQFKADTAPGAYERAVDRLLTSPAYGERWGRHWLDLARYADSNGFTRDFGREIWKYREWVIAAINAGMPFDRFTIEQFAGDMLDEPTLDQLIATGFHRNTLINEEGGTDPEQFRVDAVADRVDTTGVVYLGLTLGCARCHEHKYDPISQRDYYQVFALLNNCDEPQIDAPDDRQLEQGLVARRDAIRAEIGAKEKELANQQEAFLRAQLAWEATITPEYRRTLPGPTQAAIDQEPEERDDPQKKLVLELFKTTDSARKSFPLVEEIARLRDSQPTIPTTMILRERDEMRETFIHRRGNFLDVGQRVEPAGPSALPPIQSNSSVPNRLDFARWLVSAENPLTARVIVNRYWQRFFGTGIVATENDFGLQNIPPTHPELLDWLAVEFMESGWNVKSIQRLIVTSATYRQASHHRGDLAMVDPANKLLARQARLRMEAETIRDNSLQASGLLCHKIGGPSVFPPQPEGVFAFTQDPKPWRTETGEDRHRRGMYTHLWRSSPYPALTVFDAPDGNVTCTRRVRSNTPLQSLTLANGIQFIECAQALARDLVAIPAADRVETAFQRCLARPPTSDEAQFVQNLVQQQESAFAGDLAAAAELAGSARGGSELVRLAAWTAVARVLMNLDEFITRE